jgi:hypothetical protein
MSSARKGGSGGSKKKGAGSAAAKQASQPGLMECVQQRLIKDVFEAASGKCGRRDVVFIIDERRSSPLL